MGHNSAKNQPDKVNDLEQRLTALWLGVKRNVIDDAIDQWIRHRATEGYFEYSVWLGLVKALLTVTN